MSERIHVNIRFRPLNSFEKERHSGTHCMRMIDEEEVEVNQKRFTFDRVFNEHTEQEEIYNRVGKPVVESVLKGYNGTVLAYGQTGSGKTHTMTGPMGGCPSILNENHPNYQDRGLTLRVLSSVFEELQKTPKVEVTWKVSVTFLELYKEVLNDLLSDESSPPQELRIREDRTTGKGVFIEGIREVDVTGAHDAVKVLQRGMERKQIASTAANETSSRSHTLVTLFVTQINHVNGDTKTVGRLNLVDLAGSERIEKTGAEGERLKEAQTINLSLSLLGNVINKLTDGKSVHIPYRDSKLTRILQDSFGGNSRTTLFCNCSPSVYNQSETLSTLLFANRAKQIKNKPRINKELAGQELQVAYRKSQEELESLRSKVCFYEGQMTPRGTLRPSNLMLKKSGSMSAMIPQDNHELEELKTELKSVMKELEETKEELREKTIEVGVHDERATFYEKRELEAVGKIQEWKVRFEREKLAADSWMRKYNEKIAPPPPPAPVPKKPKPKGRSPSVKRSSITKGKPATVPSAADSEKEDEERSAIAKSLQDAKDHETAALVKEHETRQLLEEMTGRYESEVGRTSELEKKLAEAVRSTTLLDVELEKCQLTYEAKLASQDEEISKLLLRLDEKGGGGNEKLEYENTLLHEQNRDNAERLVVLTKEKDHLDKQHRQLREERDRLHHQIELANISADLKSRILGDKLRATKVAFQQRLLHCFGSDNE
eukprot:TRINITY_DN3300_c9_g1_i1.p1 TRINITY_DN3300_c9_g1~~TRINITY_DN3300_c9_g1_i1.p1  ORF type:complete len:738 (+),score=186.51 TRINITY_DN3300_c9_g1_i1:66-2216(+)